MTSVSAALLRVHLSDGKPSDALRGLYVGGGGLDQDGALSIFDGAAHMAGCAAVTGNGSRARSE